MEVNSLPCSTSWSLSPYKVEQYTALDPYGHGVWQFVAQLVYLGFLSVQDNGLAPDTTTGAFREEWNHEECAYALHIDASIDISVNYVL